MPSRPGSNASWLQCARRSYANWLCLALLIFILPVLEESKGNRMYITDSMLDGIKFPFQPGTVPAWAVPMYTTFVPSAAIGLHGVWAGMPAQVTHAGVLGSLTSLALTADITNFFKLQVGRPRPNFFYRCFPDGVVHWKDIGTNGLHEPECHPTDARDVIDGYKSFPSGHSSWSFSSLFFLSLYLYTFLCPGGRPGTGWALLAVCAPTIAAAWVAATRVTDYYHNTSDVFVGGLLGIGIALLTWRVYVSPVVGKRDAGSPLPASELGALLPRHRQDADVSSWTRYRSAPSSMLDTASA